MRIVFIGSSAFGLRCLSEILEISESKVVGVITAPKKFKISYSKDKVENVLHTDFSSFCYEKMLPCEVISDVGMQEQVLFEKVIKWQPDIFIVVGWYHMIPSKWRAICPSYGLHASLLPDYSGGAPLVWAIINGEKKTGITLFQMDDAVDAGPVIGQAEENIYPEDTIASLYSRIEDHGVVLLRANIPKLSSGEHTELVQDEKKRRIFPQRSPQDGLINLQNSCQQIFDFIRAQTKPYPGAFLKTKDETETITVWECSFVKLEHESDIGSITNIGDELGIFCSDGVLIPLHISYQGKDCLFNAEISELL
jgi:methionyl-tRNA formyltransferase